MRADLITVTAVFLATAFLTRFLGRFLLRRRLLISNGVPCAGGLAIGVPVLLVMLFAAGRTYAVGENASVFLGLGAGVLLFGVVDDLRDLGVATKLIFQSVVAAALMGIGVRTHVAFLPEAANLAVSFIWLLWVFNAFNLLDVMDGCAAGAALIVGIGFWIAAGRGDSGSWALLLAAGLAGFLAFNMPPARAYLGNSGSYLLGYLIAAGSLWGRYASGDDVLALATPLLILGLPLFDTIFLVVMRLARRRAPFRKSADHISLRFLSLGYSKRRVLFVLWALSVFYVLSAWILEYFDNGAGAAMLLCVVAVSGIIAFPAARASIHD